MNFGTPQHAKVGLERCTLNYQRTSYSNMLTLGFCPNGGTCPASGYCSDGTDCWKSPSDGPTYLAYRWFDLDGDGRTDLIASPVTGSTYDLQWGTGIPGVQGIGGPGACMGTSPPNNLPPEPAMFGPFPACPNPVYTADPNGAYTMCHGMYPWLVFRNHGNGVFGIQNGSSQVPDYIRYEPIPLETSNGESSMTSAPAGKSQGTTDLDGDGYNDGIYISSQNQSTWNVYRNNGAGLFVLSSGLSPSSYAAAADDWLTVTKPTNFGLVRPVNTQALMDVNGDGLADHWTSPDPGTIANIEINNGVSFRQPADVVLPIRPANDGDVTVTNTNGCPAGNACYFITHGWRIDATRTMDIDFDGRQDILQSGTSYGSLGTSFNQGGQFAAISPGQRPSTDSEGMLHRIVVSDQIPNPYIAGAAYSWEIRSDLIDLDGDGIPEGVSFPSGTAAYGTANMALPGKMMLSKVPTPTQPPRLLVAIDNHRGAKTQISYAPMSNTAVVTQEPSFGKSLPHTQWVVQSVTTTDSVATPATVTTTGYQYIDPKFSADDQGKYGFRGFEEVDTTLPSGAKSVERYSYSPDWSGRLVQTVLRPAEAPGEARSIDTTTWERRGLFCDPQIGFPLSGDNCAILTYHPTAVEHLTCKNGQTDGGTNPCNASTAAGYTKTSSTWTGMVSTKTSDPTLLLWTVTGTLLQSGTAAQDGDRQTYTTFAVWSDATNYRMRPLITTKSVQSGGAFAPYAKSQQTWTPMPVGLEYTVPITDEVWFDATDTNRAITRRDYDPATGNVTQRWKPVQNAANTAFAKYTYDSRKLFVTTELLEPAGYSNTSQQLDYTYEYGTGTKLETIGPNIASCAVPVVPTCPTGTPPKEVHRIKVDGLGRMIERWETFSDTGGSYQNFKIETNSYVDGPAASVSHQRAIDYAEPSFAVRYAQDKTELDGHGRPVRTTISSLGSAPADQITSYQYANDGTLRNVTVPNPAANDATTVMYSYTFDSLGRPLTVRRPMTTRVDLNGVDIVYDGLTTTSSEVLGVALGQAAVTKTIKDAFGRLAEVDEQLATTPTTTWAVTSYTYSADDNVRQITDGEGKITTLTHDFAGHRTQISRGPRTWTYGYDKNGNMVSEKVPGSAGPLTDADFTTTIAYDNLDRPASKLVGKRNLSAADVTLFGADHEVYQWDATANHSGRLYSWGTYAPGAAMPTDFIAPGWNAQGQETLTYHYVTMLASTARQRYNNRSYNLAGSVTAVYYQEYPAVSRATFSQLAYDARGLPSSMWLSLNASGYPIAIQTRNVAGLVTKRRTDLSGAMSFIESNWSYDLLGRVTSQVVQKGPGPLVVARQDLAYFGNDDPKTLDHYLGATHKTFQYGFDLRHQLLSVRESSTPGYFDADYAFDKAGRFKTASENATGAPGGDVKVRNVNYQYSATDPEEVTALTKVSDSSTFTSYTYDAAGNQLTRCNGATALGVCTGDETAYVYDGKDQLRRATKKRNGVVLGSEEYWYDAYGARNIVVKRDAAGNKTEAIWFVGEVEAHYDPTGSLIHSYCHLMMGTPVARVDRYNETVANVEYQFHGLANNTLVAVDETSGATNAGFIYAPFGELLEAMDSPTAGVAAHRRRMNDKFVDEISDLAYYGARYYDKTSMTWTQGDPLYRFAPDAAWVQPRRACLYSFDLGDPLRYLDPDGRNPLHDFFEMATQPISVSGEGSQTHLTVGPQDALGHVVATVAYRYAAAAANDLISIISGVAPPEAPHSDPPPNPTAGSTETQVEGHDSPSSTEKESANHDHANIPPVTNQTYGQGVPTSAPLDAADHTKNQRESNREKHERGQERKRRDQGGERGDTRRRPPRQRPPNYRGPWPPKKKDAGSTNAGSTTGPAASQLGII